MEDKKKETTYPHFVMLPRNHKETTSVNKTEEIDCHIDDDLICLHGARPCE